MIWDTHFRFEFGSFDSISDTDSDLFPIRDQNIRFEFWSQFINPYIIWSEILISDLNSDRSIRFRTLIPICFRFETETSDLIFDLNILILILFDLRYWFSIWIRIIRFDFGQWFSIGFQFDIRTSDLISDLNSLINWFFIHDFRFDFPFNSIWFIKTIY